MQRNRSLRQVEQLNLTGVATNRQAYQPLDGVVLAISPFNFTAIGSNLSSAPAQIRNTVMWEAVGRASIVGALHDGDLARSGSTAGRNQPCAPRRCNGGGRCARASAVRRLHFTESSAVFSRIGTRSVLVYGPADLAAVCRRDGREVLRACPHTLLMLRQQRLTGLETHT
jgi:acyl-CoA reductase-like NAD-dependent aldehyde dehydrogenase